MNIVRTIAIFLIILSAIAACGQEEPAVCHNDSGFLIINVQVIDGSGSPAVPGSVRITDGLIAEIGDLTACEAETVVDGGGQTLTPGFIDTHSHADGLLSEQPDAIAAVSQ